MKLTNKDKEILRQFGDEEADFEQIERAIGKTTYTLWSIKNGKNVGTKITAKKAIELLGREKFLSGISRSAFHWSAGQDTDDGREICFNSSRLFRE